MTKKSRKKTESARPPEHFLELSELLDYVRQVIAKGLPGAVWVRAEIASITDRRHLYLDLVQVADEGEVAKCRATLWARERFALEAKFRKATGGPLSAGLKVLLFCNAEFHAQYGFSLHILDIAPEFTLGDVALRLEASRQILVNEGVYGLNRLLPLPSDYARVAVISPAEAAGLGDFRRETDALEEAGVIHFDYLTATFQGKEAAGSLLKAIAKAKALHQLKPFDAVVLLRGGGAITDLAWLNELDLARALATFPAPVITGLGHAKDDTLPDEVACIRMDTPSKAAVLIVQTVVNAAATAQNHALSIRRSAAEILVNTKAETEWATDRICHVVRQKVDAATLNTDHLMRQILGLTPQRTLARGYVMARRLSGEPVTSSQQVLAGETLSLEWADGRRSVQVTQDQNAQMPANSSD